MSTHSFRDLHQAGNPLVLANVWNAGSAKILAASGAKALATSSAAHAFTLGVKDMGEITREQSLIHARELVGSTGLPVSGDFENGYGHSPEDVAETVLLAHQAGLAGCSIEDMRLPGTQVYEFSFAVARIEAAMDAAKSIVAETGRDFVLTARADGIMNARYDTNEAIRRLKAFARLGADVVYAPLPPSKEDLARICREVDAPVNALAAGDFTRLGVKDFAQLGVARISFGSALARVTHAALVQSASEVFQNGDFSSFDKGIEGARIEQMLDQAKQVRDLMPD